MSCDLKWAICIQRLRGLLESVCATLPGNKCKLFFHTRPRITADLSDMKSAIVSAFCIIIHIGFLQESFSAVINKSSPYPPEWETAASSLEDFPVREVAGKNVTVLDPWLYMDRLGIFKVMVISSEMYFSSWGFNNTGNLLWGLPLQFGWQMSTGRLSVTQSSTSRLSPVKRFFPSSWWADMNYFLSIIPFLGAVNAGIVSLPKNPLYILKPTNTSSKLRDTFCSSVTECASRHSELMNSWTRFFEHLRDKKAVRERDDMDATVGLLWAAHTDSIHTANPLFFDQLALLSKPEMHFGRGWALLVDFIASTHFQTNLNNTHNQQTMALPPRILSNSDQPPHIPDFTRDQNNALVIINVIYEAEVLTDGGFLYLWRKAMCSPKGRADGRDMLENLLKHPVIVAEDLVKLVIDFIKDHKC